MELIIGSHVSFNKEKQLLGSLNEALSYNANAFMLYTGAPQNTNRAKIDHTLTEEAIKLMQEKNIDIENIIVHAPYIINLANGKNMEFNIRFLKEEIKRVDELGLSKIVIHPGSHVGLGEDVGIENIIEALNMAIAEDTKQIICLETMAGKGSEIGLNFEQLKKIIDGVTYSDKIGVCLDTCHIWDAGYDLNDFDRVLAEFDEIIGLSKLKVIHVNDSKNINGAKKDRHENIGFGNIGFNILNNIVHHEKLKDIPKILETPYVECGSNKYPPYLFEIKMLKEKKFNKNLISDINNYYS